jgi:hypothetical protein
MDRGDFSMSKMTEEQRRLAQIRDRQLNSRDPHKKGRKLQGVIATKHRKAQQSFSLWEIFNIPHKWKWTIYGLFFGTIVFVVLSVLVVDLWGQLVGVVAIVASAIFGFFIGQAIESRENIKDHLRR